MTSFHTNSCRPITLILCLLFPATVVLAAKGIPFGTTGIFGEMHPGWPKKSEAIRVTKLEEGSPAEGKLNEGDIIIGIGDQAFQIDPRSGFAFAINQAEAEGGKMPLLLENGKKVVIQIPALGSYSLTAPYNCPKTDDIIDQAAKSILTDERIGTSPTRTDLLGLMATGEKDHLNVVSKVIKANEKNGVLDIDAETVEGFLSGTKIDGGPVTAGWGWGYNLITLGEYYLLTKDEDVLPAIRLYALGLARGQDAVGLWGHRMATTALGGRLAGYAQMNQPSLSNLMAMIIARKCGIKDPVLDQAIERTYAYVADHVGKGSFPYGVHGPQPTYFNNNGMSGLAAICMSLMGNQEGASYFSEIAAASHDQLHSGHASPFFNPLWTPLGVALSGPGVTHEFFMQSLWYFNGQRHWEGGFPGRTNTGTYNGQALLTYCLPRRALLITGREADPSIWVKSDAQATEIVMRNRIVDETKSNEELLEALNHPFTQVSWAAAKELTNRMRATRQANEEDSIMPELMKLIKEGSDRQQINTMQSFGHRCPSVYALPHVETIGAILRNPDEPLEVRLAAAGALGTDSFGEAARPYYNDVLKLAFEKLPNDPFNLLLVEVSTAATGISDRPFEAGLVTDKPLFYRTAMRFLDHKRQQVRGDGLRMLRGMPLEDFYLVAERFTHVMDNDDPSYHSYHNMLEIGIPGIEALAGLRIRDGLDYLVQITFSPTGKWGFKRNMLFQTLPLYGGNAGPYIPKLEEHRNIPGTGKSLQKWKDLVTAIEEDKDPHELISLAEAIAAGKKQPH